MPGDSDFRAPPYLLHWLFYVFRRTILKFKYPAKVNGVHICDLYYLQLFNFILIGFVKFNRIKHSKYTIKLKIIYFKGLKI